MRPGRGVVHWHPRGAGVVGVEARDPQVLQLNCIRPERHYHWFSSEWLTWRSRGRSRGSHLVNWSSGVQAGVQRKDGIGYTVTFINNLEGRSVSFILVLFQSRYVTSIIWNCQCIIMQYIGDYKVPNANVVSEEANTAWHSPAWHHWRKNKRRKAAWTQSKIPLSLGGGG